MSGLLEILVQLVVFQTVRDLLQRGFIIFHVFDYNFCTISDALGNFFLGTYET